jgi:hypothetical protein
MNGQSRDTGNETRDEDKSKNKKHNNQKTKKDEEHSPYQKPV